MKTKITQIALTGLLISFIIPNLAAAAWWNPFSWKWFNKSMETEVILVATSTDPVAVTHSTTTLATTSTTNTQSVAEKPLPEPIIETIAPKIAPPVATTASPVITPPVMAPQPVRLKPVTATVNQDCSILQDPAQKDNCYLTLAKSGKDPATCPNINDIGKRNNCYLLVAYHRKDQTLCKAIIDGNGTVTQKLCTDTVKDPVYSASTPKGIIITDFLKDPTLENFKTFCEKAKGVEGLQVEKTMDDSKESLITKKLSYYYDLEDCVYLNDSEETFYFALDNGLRVELESNDPDWYREAKLLYNDKIQNLINTSGLKFVSFEKSMFSRIPFMDEDEFEDIESPQELFAYYLSGIKNVDDHVSQFELESEQEEEMVDDYVRNYKEKIKGIPNSVSELKVLYRNLTREID